MIVAKTDLEKIPDRCCDCEMFVFEASDYGYCPITTEQMDCNEMEYRSLECPLKEVSENALS